MLHTFFIHSSIGGHRSPYFGYLNSANINLSVQVSQLYVDLHFFVCMLRSGTAGSYAISISSVLRNVHTDFHSGCN
jgi:hypothetical protein